MKLTRDILAAEAPELLAAIQAEAQALGKTEGFTAGATAERERIQSVEAQALPGHDALIATLKFDGKTTGAEAAMAVNAAERTLRTTALSQLRVDAPAPAAAPAAPADPAAQAGEDTTLPLAERAKAKWDADANLRSEFTSFDAYLGYARAAASGKIRVLGRKPA